MWRLSTRSLVSRHKSQTELGKRSDRPRRAFPHGLLADHQEAASTQLRHPRLCPMLLALPGDLLILQRRAAPLSPAQHAALDPADWGGVLGVVEFKPDSFGLLAGRVVAVDYGG